jgi:hypothetical protein
VPTALSNVGDRGQIRRHLLAPSFTGFEPEPTELAVSDEVQCRAVVVQAVQRPGGSIVRGVAVAPPSSGIQLARLWCAH